MATGEEVSGAGTMSVPASVIGRRGRGVRAAASGSSRSGGSRVLQPCIRLQRLAGTRPSAASVEVAMTISDDDESDDSEASTSTVSAASVYSDAVGPGATTAATTGRKRGRPPTTGEYVGLTEAKKRLLELKRQELELYDEAAVLDPTVPPPRVSRSCKPLRDKAGVAAEMRHAPTPDLGAVIAEKVAVVEKVAGTSKHLKGTYVHSLREAALFIRHTAAEQAKRTVVSEKEVELERELRQLRARLEATEALSRAHDDGLAAGANGAPALDAVAMPPPSPPGSRRSRRASARAAAGVAQSQVVGRKERKRKAAAAAAPAPPKVAGAKTQQAAPSSSKRDGGRRPPRVPTRAAVALTVAPGSKTPYAEVMRRAVAGVPLAEVGITDLRYRKGQTGSSILEVPGPESSAKADALAVRLAELFRGTDVRVTRPAKTAEMWLAGLDESVTAEAVAAAVARVSGCTVAEVRPGEIRRNASGLGTVWLRCPLAASRRLTTAGRVTIGWSSARVEPLEARPLRCLRCLEPGHVRAKCSRDADRAGRCFGCGSREHQVRECDAAPKCPVCTDLGRAAGHRLGSKSCAPAPSRRGRRERGTAASEMPLAAPEVEMEESGLGKAMVAE
ncbi:PREDICTED: uncharacterized protein LOC107195129 [Dufourea novaeangliae]|uniref:uncharacterized protein LOC107195129 n=1 Tax=Dufourea novaeangliae TaxID=178035 RepID=UPI000767B0B2|nr:PREDICTED: uncharacterized protein LOC107195129 [Dufourea novaeangliae]